MPADLVIRHGTVLDGTGRDPFAADVLVGSGRIRAIGEVGPVDAPELDATDLFVSPGFIDIHSHSDYTLLVDPRAVSAIHQGVTLEVVGNCGHGCFPITDPELAKGPIYGYHHSLPLTWSSAAEYFERLEAARPAVNVLSLVPNGQLRLAVVGLKNRAATSEELREMEMTLEQALEEGAWGFSTGLEYAAEASATEEEIETLCRTVARHNGLYATHTRDRDENSVEAVEEALRTAERANVRLQVSHLVPRSGEEPSRACAEAVDRSRDRDLDVAFDMHTRLFGLTYLASALPAWALADGSEQLASLLRDKATRAELRRHRSIITAGGDWSRIVLFDNPAWPEYARRDIASIAVDRGEDPADTIYELLAATVDDVYQLMVLINCYTESQQRESFAHPLCMPGSDATTLAPTGALASSFFHGAYTWASWFYRFMVRDTGLLTPADAIRRMTSMPAERLGLSDRGVLRAGAPADVAIFDPAAFCEQATTYEPNQLAVGMRHVLVNGVFTLRDGALTEDRAGWVLRRSNLASGTHHATHERR